MCRLILIALILLVPVQALGQVKAYEPKAVLAARENAVLIMEFGGNTKGYGSGCYVGNGFVVTCAHGHAEASKLSVLFRDGQSSLATCVYADTSVDLAVLKLDRDVTNYPGVDLRVGMPDKTEQVWWYGYPSGDPKALSYATGTITSYNTMGGFSFTGSGVAVGGMSGGPCFDENGYLIADGWGSNEERYDNVIASNAVMLHALGAEDEIKQTGYI